MRRLDTFRDVDSKRGRYFVTGFVVETQIGSATELNKHLDLIK